MPRGSERGNEHLNIDYPTKDAEKPSTQIDSNQVAQEGQVQEGSTIERSGTATETSGTTRGSAR
jgi:hypothetical protein